MIGFTFELPAKQDGRAAKPAKPAKVDEHQLSQLSQLSQPLAELPQLANAPAVPDAAIETQPGKTPLEYFVEAIPDGLNKGELDAQVNPIIKTLARIGNDVLAAAVIARLVARFGLDLGELQDRLEMAKIRGAIHRFKDATPRAWSAVPDSVPFDWRAGLAEASAASRPSIVPEADWRAWNRALVAIIESPWAPALAAAGWELRHLTSYHPAAPLRRFDVAGLAVLLEDDELIGVDSDGRAMIRTRTGAIHGATRPKLESGAPYALIPLVANPGGAWGVAPAAGSGEDGRDA